MTQPGPDHEPHGSGVEQAALEHDPLVSDAELLAMLARSKVVEQVCPEIIGNEEITGGIITKGLQRRVAGSEENQEPRIEERAFSARVLTSESTEGPILGLCVSDSVERPVDEIPDFAEEYVRHYFEDNPVGTVTAALLVEDIYFMNMVTGLISHRRYVAVKIIVNGEDTDSIVAEDLLDFDDLEGEPDIHPGDEGALDLSDLEAQFAEDEDESIKDSFGNLDKARAHYRYEIIKTLTALGLDLVSGS